MKRELGIILVAAGLVVGCGGTNNTCVPGMSTACTCSDGSAGAQACQSDGTYAACQCDVASGGNGSGGGGGNTNGGGGASGGGGGGVGAGPIAIMNASARATTTGGTTYDITFTVQNVEWDTDSIETVQKIAFSWKGTMLTWSGACSGTPWSIPAKVTPVIEIDLLANAGAPQASANVPCNSTYDAVDVGMPATAPSGSINLDIEGILSDATPFKATASAPVL